jgi:hypothetical protein
MTTTEIVAKEQILKSLLQDCNTTINDKIIYKQTLRSEEERNLMDSEIKRYRDEVLTPLQNKICDLTNEKFTAVGLTNNFTWKI